MGVPVRHPGERSRGPLDACRVQEEDLGCRQNLGVIRQYLKASVRDSPRKLRWREERRVWAQEPHEETWRSQQRGHRGASEGDENRGRGPMKTAFLEGGRDGPRQRLQTRNNWGGGASR